MAILTPTTCATFGDATRTDGKGLGRGPLRKYVLAQFRGDQDLEWMRRLRAALGSSEVKYKQVKERRPTLKKDTDLWSSIEKGVGQATLIVIDPEPANRTVRTAYRREGAHEGLDFHESDVTSRAATALVAGTPLAWLPSELAKVVGRETQKEDEVRPPWCAPATWRGRRAARLPNRPSPSSSPTSPGAMVDRFAPEQIRLRIGPKLRAATVFAARTHAMFDVRVLDETLRSTRDVYRSPIAAVILREILSTPRMFDEEDRESVRLLNDASEQIASAVVDGLPRGASLSTEPLVREADSREVDFVQAADVAAGWARDVIDGSGVRALGVQFERIWVNGHLLKGPELPLYDARSW